MYGVKCIKNMASKPVSDSENIVSNEGISSSEVLSKTEDRIGAFIKDVTGGARARGVKPFKKCKSATFKVDGTCFTIGKVVLISFLFLVSSIKLHTSLFFVYQRPCTVSK